MNLLERYILQRELNKMLNNVTQHLKTTLTGAALAALQVLANGRDWKTIALAVLTAVLGALAQDPSKQEKK